MYTETLQAHLALIESTLPAYMPQKGGLQDVVVRGMQYACEAGGKRLRPVLTLEFCRLCCGDAKPALPFACAVEMIHSYSLVHDDLPCMDNSPLRRGKPSVHAAFGEDMALLTGDALLTWAFEIMTRPDACENIPAKAVLEAVQALSRHAGINGMVGGQTIDLLSEHKTISVEELVALQEGKTAALITAACEIGCLIGGADEEKRRAAALFGYNLGLCFQIVDDILDVTATAEQLGKPVGSDAENTKNTYVSLLGLDKSRSLAAERTEAAVAALQPFGKQAEDLCRLAETLLNRRS